MTFPTTVAILAMFVSSLLHNLPLAFASNPEQHQSQIIQEEQQQQRTYNLRGSLAAAVGGSQQNKKKEEEEESSWQSAIYLLMTESGDRIGAGNYWCVQLPQSQSQSTSSASSSSFPKSITSKEFGMTLKSNQRLLLVQNTHGFEIQPKKCQHRNADAGLWYTGNGGCSSQNHADDDYPDQLSSNGLDLWGPCS